MTKRPTSMFYAYFRFYVDESEIEAGLKEYCTDWEHMFAVGYNYKEYKCFVDNIGGFEHFVGDMRGYISQTREMGFIDGAPGDGVFDQTLIMGVTRIIVEQVEMLSGFGKDAICYLRKITAKDAGTDHRVEFKISTTQKVKHPVMYTLDSSQIEMFKLTNDIEDNSDVDEYEVMVDVNRDYITTPVTVHSNLAVTVVDIEKMFDGDIDTYCRLSGRAGASGTTEVVFDAGKECNSFGVYGHNWTIGTDPQTDTKIYISNDLIAWTEIVNTDTTDQDYAGGKLEEKYRYIKFDFYNADTIYYFRCDVFMMIRR